jgi:hypothetical protein
MAEVSYSLLLPEINLHAKSAAEPVAINAIRNACVEFCRDSLYLTQDFDPVPVIAGTAEYEPDLPSTAYTIGQIIDPIYVNDRIVRALPPAQLRRAYGSGWRTKTGTVERFVMFDPGVITLVPIPDTSYPTGLVGQYALVPTRTSTTIRDTLLEDFREEIAAGALARLLMEPETGYQNPELAKGMYQMFRKGVSAAKLATMKSHVSAATMVQMRKF